MRPFSRLPKPSTATPRRYWDISGRASTKKVEAGSASLFVLIMVAFTSMIVISAIQVGAENRRLQTHDECLRVAQNAFDGEIDTLVSMGNIPISLSLPASISATIGNVSGTYTVVDNSLAIPNTLLVTGALGYRGETYQLSQVIGSGATNLVTNGDFSESPFPANSSQSVTSLDGWTVLNAPILACGAGFENAPDQEVNLALTSNGAIEQTVTTVQGKHYQVSFYVFTGANQGAVDFLINGTEDASGLQGTSGSDVNACRAFYTFTFYATATSTTLELQADSGSVAQVGQVTCLAIP